MLLEDVAEVNVVVFVDVLNAKDIDNEDEYNRFPLVKPEARCCGSLLVFGFLEACGKEVVGNLVSLGKSLDAFLDF